MPRGLIFDPSILTVENTNGLVVWMPFDDGGAATDKSGNAHNGALSTNVVASNEGILPPGLQPGSGLKFNGVDTDVTITGVPALQTLTVCCWMKLSAVLSAMLVMRSTVNATWEMFCDQNAGVPVLRFRGAFSGDNLHSTKALVANAWHFCAATCDSSGNAAVFLNGEYTTGTATPIPSNTNAIHIGNFDNSNFFANGTIADVRIYNRVLSQAELSDIYQRGLLSLPEAEWPALSAAAGAPSGNLSQAAGIGVAGVIGSSLAPGAIPQASATGSAGLLTPSDASSLTGVAGIGVAGSPTTSLANGGVPPATGIGTVGSLAPNDASSLAGVAGIGVAGSLTPLVAVTLNSATGIGTAGQFTFGTVGRLTQAAGTGVAGTITVSTTASPALGQAAGTGVAGAFNASISVSFSQGVGVGVARGVSPAVSALLAQASGIGAAGGISAQVTGGTVSSTLPAAVGIGVAGVITAFSSTALVATPGGNGGVKNKKRKQVQFAPVERKRVSKPKPAPLQAPALPPQPTRKPGRFENTLVPADPAPPAAPRKLEDLSRFGISAELPSDLNDYAMAERLMAQLEHDERPIRDTIMATIAQIKADIASDLIGA